MDGKGTEIVVNPDRLKTISEYVARLQNSKVPDSVISKTLADKGWPLTIINQALTNKSPAIKIRNLKKSFSNQPIIDNISLEINKGDLVGIIGLSGSGKTTLLNMIIGLLAPDGGGVFYRHPINNSYISVTSQRKEICTFFGYAPQDPSFYNRLTVMENIDHFGALYNIRSKQRKEKITSLLSLVGLSNSAKTLGGNLSGGMQRRLGIACSLVHDPSVLILDEPTADLDPIMRREIWNLIRQVNSAGTTVILTSHFLNEVEFICSHIAILHNKQIAAIGSPSELREKHSANDEVQLEIATHGYDKIVGDLKKSRLSIKQISIKENKLIINTTDAEDLMHWIVHYTENSKIKIINISLTKPGLCDVFESIVKEVQ